MNNVVRLIRRAAPMDSTILITGETGVGKEVVARAVHRFSGRATKPVCDGGLRDPGGVSV